MLIFDENNFILTKNNLIFLKKKIVAAKNCIGFTQKINM